MKPVFLRLILSLTSALAVGSAFGQITDNGIGATVHGVRIDTRRFIPQIDARAHTAEFEKDHELRHYPAGAPNNLVAGGTLPDPRIGLVGSFLFPGMSATGFEPPDPDLAVGPNYIVEVVNSSIAFFSKSGSKVFEQTEQNFFKSVSPQAFDYDPKVIYDQLAKRFVVLDLDLNDASSGGASDLLIAVSDTSDPNGGWKIFKVDVKQTSGSNTYWWDYPGLGYNKDMVCMTGNMFAMTGSSGFNGVQIVAFDKTQLYSGTATPNKFTVSDGFTIQLSKTAEPTVPSVYGVETWSNTSMRLTAVTKSGSSFNVSQSTVAVPLWSEDAGFLTGPGGVQVQTNDPRILVSCAGFGRLLASHNVAVSSSDSRCTARWYDFNLNGWPASGTPSLKQSGQFDPPAGHGYSFPAIQFDGAKNIGMTFSKIGSTTPGDVMGSGRKETDPAGTMGKPITLAASTAGQYSSFSTRWGDMFDVKLDPADSKTFWAVGMGAGASVGGHWQTYIKNFKIAAADADLTHVLPSPVSVVAGAWVSGNAGSLSLIDNNQYTIHSQFVAGLGQVAGFSALYTMPYSGAIDTLRLFITMSGPTGSSGLISLFNNKTGTYDQVLTAGLSPTGVTKTLDLTADQIAAYANSLNKVSMIVRAVNPSRGGQLPPSFTFSADQAIFGTLPKS